MSGFVDEAQVHVKAGDGGAGAVSFRREAHVSMGGPDGGDGGRGGDVWLVASANVSSLLAFRDRPHRRAGDGRHGQGKRRHGARGADLEVPVPVGTTVRTLDGAAVADLAAPGVRWRAAEGGRGGHGNARFGSNRLRAPAFAEQGERGEEHWYDLELRLVADVALVGFPNAGKSTLISRISAARPKVADYPFTTLEPHLGVVRPAGVDDGDFVVADVPGLVEGAADGRGLGHRFLRHVERARCLLVLLDPVAADGRSPEDQLAVLLHELGRYRADLLERPRLVVATKHDVVLPDEERSGPWSMAISAVTGEGLVELVGRLATLVAAGRRADEATAGWRRTLAAEPSERGTALGGPSTAGTSAPGTSAPGTSAPERLAAGTSADARWEDGPPVGEGPADGVPMDGVPMDGAPVGGASSAAEVVHRPLPEGVVVTRTGAHRFEVSGRAVLRAVALSDLTDPDAAELVQRRLRRLGVERALVRAGVVDGDEVEVGPLSFVYHRDDVVVVEPTGDGRRDRRSRSERPR